MKTFLRIIVSLFAMSLIFSCSLIAKKKDKNSAKDNTEIKKPGGDDPVETPETPMQLTGLLHRFQSCDDVKRYFEEQIIAQMRRELDDRIACIQETDQCYGEVVMDSAAPGGTVSAEKSNSAEPADFTTTNNQVTGVEESDFVKNTGTNIFQIAAGKLQVLKSWPASEMSLLSTVEFEGRPFQMLLTENQKLVVLTTPKINWETEQPSIGVEAKVGYIGSDYRPEYDYEAVEVVIVDVASPTTPKIQSKFLLKGSFISARRIANSVRIILNSYLSYYNLFNEGDEDMYLPSYENNISKEEQIIRLKALHEKRVAKIKAQPLSYWLSSDSFFKISSDNSKKPVLDTTQCSNIFAPSIPTELGLTRVDTLNLDTDNVTETVLVSYIQEVYASKEALYLSTPRWWWQNEEKSTDETYIHKFDLTNAEKADYLATGIIEGRLINQFAMDEFNGDLRLAATVTKINQDIPEIWTSQSTVNRVVVLSQKNDTLEIIGQTQDLAPNESIQSVRFDGARGYVVTFRRVDPLFSVDLADPKNPKVVGELKIPGFSEYMQKIDDNHLLAIGRDADPVTGRTKGLKLSIFNVADLTAPKEVKTLLIEEGFWSDASWDHKAFTYFPAKKLLGIPASGYHEVGSSSTHWWDEYRSTLLVFKIDVQEGITKVADIDMTDIYVGAEREYSWWSTSARVSRSIFADDFVYAISNLGIRTIDVRSPTVPLSTVRYECDDQCYSWWYY